jgi:uncharacterized membrane protein
VGQLILQLNSIWNTPGDTHQFACHLDEAEPTQPAKKEPEAKKLPKNSEKIGRNSIIAIIVLGIVIIIISICVVVGFFCYKRKMSKKIEGKVIYSRGMGMSKDSDVFDGKQNSVKFFHGKRNGRLESNGSASSTMPLMFSRQNSFRTRIPSNGIQKMELDLNLNEGNYTHIISRIILIGLGVKAGVREEKNRENEVN